jgi:hypothetical protein
MRSAVMARFVAAFALAVAVTAQGVPATAPPPPAAEHELKAAFLFQFTRFVEWPEEAFASPDAPFVLCVIGPDPFGGALGALESRAYRSHRIVARNVRSASDARACHLAYFSVPPGAETREILAAMRDVPVLTVSSQERFAASGGMVGFVSADGRVRFAVNVDATRRARLRMSAKILEVAAQVIGDPTKAGP